ncbi:sensor histidine kinase [Streptomyces sp. CBMA156]|uniref:sensor histidine kinase n=1 Tax=Streptomyces sp. CBMA156 TaxID=1930280 RepID=UPI001661FD9A|nr:sensor histidine kinase [Streptomyces sp. CBMA156]MBD0673619.1 two-component sensor histidine kinase [Streptomyces sp. CBMA156]
MIQRPQPGDRFRIRILRRWYAAAWVILGVCPPVVSALNDDGTTKYWSFALAAVIALGYATVAAFPRNPVLRPHIFLGLLVLGLGALSLLRGDGAALFIVSLPQFWLFARSPRYSIAFSGAAAAATVAGIIRHQSRHVEDFSTGNIVFTLIGYTVSVLLGLGVVRIVEQSDERARRLACELESAQRSLAEAHKRRGATEERERLAREIHDTLAQGFASIIVLAEAARSGLDTDPGRSARQLLSIENTARENFAEARVLVGSAPQSGPALGSVAGALRRTLDRFTEDTGLTVTADLPDVECDQPTRIALLRCTQESLANVRKHAAASAVEIVLTASAYGVELEITDDGRGFVVEDSAGFGLNGMRNRLAELGGELTVTSSPGDGTRVLAVIPTNSQV